MKEQRRDSKPRVLIVLKQNEHRAGRAGELGLLALRWNRLLLTFRDFSEPESFSVSLVTLLPIETV